jgi:hypothetical protein
MSSDSSDVDAALLAVLRSDATLAALLPGGMFFDDAPPNSRAFGVLSVLSASDVQRFEGRSHEETLYLAKAVVLSTEPDASATCKAAAARIDVLLDKTRIAATGYAPMACLREERVRYTETDDVDPTIRYLHRGGQYRVVMSIDP